MPVAVTRLLATLDEPSSAARDVARIIESDQGLTVKLLRLANSAAVGVKEPIGNAHRATVLLGYGTIRGMALAYGLFTTMGSHQRGPIDQHFWAHGVAAGIAAQEIARRSRCMDPADAFALGLLHDIGQLVLAYFAGEHYRPIVERHESGGVPLQVLEQQELGCTHAQVGAAFLRQWNMPSALVHAIEFHHEVWKVQGLRIMPALATLSDSAACQASYHGRSGTPGKRAWSPGMARVLRLETRELDDVVSEVQCRLLEHAALLRIVPPLLESDEDPRVVQRPAA